MRSPLQHRRSTTVSVAIALALAACGDDDPAAVTVSFEQPSGGAAVAGGVPLSMGATVDVGITDRDEWCAVGRSLDELFSSAEDAGDDFPAAPVGYENIRRTLAQLGDALDEVDAELRPDIADHMDDASTIATAYVEADDRDAAEARSPQRSARKASNTKQPAGLQSAPCASNTPPHESRRRPTTDADGAETLG